MLTSSIWEEPHETFRVWLTMLLMANKDGIVDASVPGLARLARVTLEECEQALAVLSNPDRFSRTPDREGRRIEPVEGAGWRLVNHAKYRQKLGVEERREYKRQHEQARRERRRAPGVATRAIVTRTRGESVDK